MASKDEKKMKDAGQEELEILELGDSDSEDILFAVDTDDADRADDYADDTDSDADRADDASDDTDGASDDTDGDTDKAEGNDSAADSKDLKETLRKIKETASEEDPRPSGQLTLRKILGGDLLTTQLVRRQIWLVILMVAFSTVYVAFRYQCQQDMLTIDKLEGQLKHSKFRALSASSTLTEKCRESRVLEVLKQNADSTLRQPDQPPYIVEVPE